MFEVNAAVGGDTMVVLGAGDADSSTLNGEPHRYRLHHGDGQGGRASTLIDVPLEQGHITMHYKAANEKYDLWLDDTKLVADFPAFGEGDPNRSEAYDADFVQLGSGAA